MAGAFGGADEGLIGHQVEPRLILALGIDIAVIAMNPGERAHRRHLRDGLAGLGDVEQQTKKLGIIAGAAPAFLDKELRKRGAIGGEHGRPFARTVL